MIIPCHHYVILYPVVRGKHHNGAVPVHELCHMVSLAEEWAFHAEERRVQPAGPMVGEDARQPTVYLLQYQHVKCSLILNIHHKKKITFCLEIFVGIATLTVRDRLRRLLS